MTTYPNMGLVLPTRGAPGSGIWHDALDEDIAAVDAHNHTPGKGLRIPTLGINIDADLTFSSVYAPINLHRVAFAAVEALSSGTKSLFVSSADNELYWRTNAGANVKVTSGAALNVAAFTGGIGGDYAAVGAAVAYDDSSDRYTFKQQSPGNWARLAAGEVRIFETGTSESVYVGMAAPTALGASYTVTWPTAPPGSTSLMAMTSAGVVAVANPVADAVTFGGLVTVNAGLTAAANQHVTVSGTGDYRHGDRTMVIPGSAMAPTANAIVVSSGYGSSTAGANIWYPIPLLQGDRIKSVTVALFGDGAVDLSIDVMTRTPSGSNASINVSPGLTVTNAPASWNDTAIDVTDTTIASGTRVGLLIFANAAGILVDNIRVVYDHP